MRLSGLALALVASLALASAAGAADASRAGQILARLANANQWRDHVMIVAHRGGWKENGRIVTAENSVAGVNASIALGVEIVELDVQASRDGHFVVMHDTWLDRTTTCRGLVVEHTLAQLKACRIVIEGTGAVTDERVATLAEMLAVTKDRVLVNIDNKLGPGSIAGMVAVARSVGVEDQVILKENIWNTERLSQVRRLVSDAGDGFHFMPIVADDAVRDPRFVETVSATMASSVVEMINWRNAEEGMTPTGGALFSPRTRAVSTRVNCPLSVNAYPILNKPSGYLAGGRGDELAVSSGQPQEVFGFWVDRGATIIQTDEPKAAIAWLETNGYRRPYEGQAGLQSAAIIN